MNLNEPSQIRSPGHLKYVRGFECSVGWASCEGPIEAAHVRTGTDGGTAVKPGDNWTIPLCSRHHAIQHQIGESRFENDYAIDMKAIAKALWDKSPHRQKLLRVTP